ncbi:sporulation histidine kinase inhibitor Sda [Halobacillus yeomjeoni]|uniref:Sporulation histidine kinase inhibitor Sda n=2 Tax=Halobacillus yeomjeoni TaxID=311194 RepID=A0A931MUF4_9BACI|nr:sporulation histidine kinase inhibitor Sda [Halobacillus yeomjeoni]MBH0229948.1 sporulation histidine kinase inhibitor Sda [Halobacillus yeomjeoni]MCA0982674.1 sporulation histidine kinase inhibitor Sda [Halobacillus yeomjeoni]
MKQLSDSLLIQSYHKALELNLSDEFINQITQEIRNRSIQHLLDKYVTHVG